MKRPTKSKRPAKARMCLIVQQKTRWSLTVNEHTDQLPANADDESIARAAVDLCQRADVKEASVILAPHSDACFFYSLDVTDQIDIRDRSVLAYELENHLPIDAESMVADFVATDSGESLSSVAIAWQRWRGLADRLEEHAMPVVSIVPSAILVARGLATATSGQVSSLMPFLLIEDDDCDCVNLGDGKVVHWKRIGLDPQSMEMEHRLQGDAFLSDLMIVGGNPEQQATVTAVFPQAQVADESIDERRLQGASLFMAGQSDDWFDLRREALSPSDPLRAVQKQLRLAAIAGSLCLLAIAVGGLWRSHRIETKIGQLRDQQSQLFREAMPGTRVPVALLRRVRSEHKRMMGSRGTSQGVDVPIAAPGVLKSFLRGLPEKLRFQIQRIEINDGKLSVDLKVRSPVDAGKFVTALSEAGFEISPPVTTQGDDHLFDSRISGRWQP